MKILFLWLAIVASLGNASALTPGATENRVWQKSAATLETRQADPLQTVGRHQENGGAGYDVALNSLLAAESTVAEQGRNALGQFTSKVGGQAAPGSTAVSDFVQNATQNGWSLVDREVSFNTPFGMRRYDAVLTDSGGVNWGFEIKSSESAFSRWEGQQFSADRWINMNGGATAIGKQSGLQINGSAKLLWPTP